MTYIETLERITTDERFASYQNYDPDLLQNLEYFDEIPANIVKYCYSLNDEGTEPFFEEVVELVKLGVEIEKQEIRSTK